MKKFISTEEERFNSMTREIEEQKKIIEDQKLQIEQLKNENNSLRLKLVELGGGNSSEDLISDNSSKGSFEEDDIDENEKIKNNKTRFDSFERKKLKINKKLGEEFDLRTQPSREINKKYIRENYFNLRKLKMGKKITVPKSKTDFENVIERFEIGLDIVNKIYEKKTIKSMSNSLRKYIKLYEDVGFLRKKGFSYILCKFFDNRERVEEEKEEIEGEEENNEEEANSPFYSKRKHREYLSKILFVLKRIGICYYHLEMYDKSISQCESLLELISRKGKHFLTRNIILKTRDMIYSLLIDCRISKQEYRRAEKYLHSQFYFEYWRNLAEMKLERARDIGEDVYTFDLHYENYYSEVPQNTNSSEETEEEDHQNDCKSDGDFKYDVILKDIPVDQSVTLTTSQYLKLLEKTRLSKRTQREIIFQFDSTTTTTSSDSLESTSHPFNVKNFNLCCANRNNTLIVFVTENKNRILGGFNPMSWRKTSGGGVSSNNSNRLKKSGSLFHPFIFGFVEKEDEHDEEGESSQNLEIIKINGGSILSCSSHSFGFCSGKSDGLYVCGEKGVCRLRGEYKLHDNDQQNFGHQSDDDDEGYLNGGDIYFRIKKCEVFAPKRRKKR